MNYTTKTQYLFRINKGILNSWNNEEINRFTPDEKRRYPFSRMIYIGDGETDVPAMKMINYQGGYSIVVYPPKEGQRRNPAEMQKKTCLSMKLSKAAETQRMSHRGFQSLCHIRVRTVQLPPTSL